MMKFKETKRGVCTDGFKAAGIRKKGYGVALIAAYAPCKAAGVFTKDSVKAAPVVLSKKRVKGDIQTIISNSGCANACTPKGLEDAEEMASIAAKTLGLNPSDVAVASTGLIGKKLDLKTIKSLTKEAATQLSSSGKASLQAAKAIMTTDTKPKQYSIEYHGVQVGGIAKGAGMIHPDLATMLCFITTNAKLTKRILQSCLKKSAGQSFNMLSIEGDMSTNDTVLLLSSGEKVVKTSVFQNMLDQVTRELAKMIAKDGEGASKFIEVQFKGASTRKDAEKAAKAIVSSPLVKTAIYGQNPNWGRIAAKAGEVIKVKFDKMSITFSSNNGKAKVLSKGVGIKSGNAKTLRLARKILTSKEIQIVVDLGEGKSEATAWGCDMTPEYVRINAEYN
ncbi:bifunctional ornithine acetyltransferase/N-acetylglutamate synthase [Candidatus Altiarchaeota archaeon]